MYLAYGTLLVTHSLYFRGGSTVKKYYLMQNCRILVCMYQWENRFWNWIRMVPLYRLFGWWLKLSNIVLVIQGFTVIFLCFTELYKWGTAYWRTQKKTDCCTSAYNYWTPGTQSKSYGWCSASFHESSKIEIQLLMNGYVIIMSSVNTLESLVQPETAGRHVGRVLIHESKVQYISPFCLGGI